MPLHENYLPIRRQLFTGMNSRGHPQLIGPTQLEVGRNLDLTQLGRNKKRAGFATVANDVGAADFTNLVRFNPRGGSDILLGMEDTNLRKWTGSGNWSAALDSGFTATDYTLLLPGNDICIISNGTDNVHYIDNADTVTDCGDLTADAPKGALVGCYAKDRFFMALNDIVYFSNVVTTAGAEPVFDRATNIFRVNQGDNSSGEITNIVPFRNDELVIFKKESIWLLRMTGNSDPLNDWTLEPIDTSTPKSIGTGCIAKDSAIKVGDDIYYWAVDGVRSLRRNEQDKIIGLTLPISDPIYTTYIEGINHSQTDKIRGIYFENKLIFAAPFGSSSVADYWFVYHFQTDPQLNGWTYWDGFATTAFAKYPVSGEERLYFSDDADNGQIYRWPSGTSDNGTAIAFEMRGRMEDLSEMGMGAHKKVGQSLYATFEAAGGSTATIDAQKDEQGFSGVGTQLLTNEAPTLPVDLDFELIGSSVIRSKFNLQPFEHWYNFQWKITQDTLDEELTVQEIAIFSTVEDYEHEV